MDNVQRRIEAAAKRSDAARRAHVTRRRRYGIAANHLGGNRSQFPHLTEAARHGAYAKHVIVAALSKGRAIPGWEDTVYWAVMSAAHYARLHLETEYIP